MSPLLTVTCQNTGGFFLALLEKVAALPWESRREARVKEEGEEVKEEAEEKPKEEAEPPKKKRFWGFKEDPYIYCKVPRIFDLFLF